MGDFGIDFGEGISKTNELAPPLLERLKKEGVKPGFLTSEIFKDPKFNDQFLSHLSPDDQYQYLKNSSLLEAKLSKEKWASTAEVPNSIFGPESTAPEVLKSNGEIRPAETEKTIMIHKLQEAGIDPSKTLIFRATQPSDTPKPELYWTTDYTEAKRGLTDEMGITRNTAVILVSNLELVCRGGAIRDKNDDHGLPVRRIDPSPLDQKSLLGIIRP